MPSQGPSRYRKWRRANDASNLGWVINPVFLIFVGYLIADQDGVAEILGINSPSPWKTLLLVLAVAFGGAYATGLTSGILQKYTGIVYTEDRTAFARAGGFDIGRGPTLLAQLGVFGIYWATSKMDSDPLGFARSPWVYVAVSTLIALVATKLLAERVFSRHAATRGQFRPSRVPRGMRITVLTPERLELAHHTVVFRSLAALLCFGGAVWIYAGGTDWKEWIGIALLVVLGAGLLMGASTRRVIFDKSENLFETRDRHLLGRTTTTRLPLHAVSAVLESQETMGDSQLTNLSVRIGEARHPVIIGSRLAANTHEAAVIIGLFLEVPVYEDEKLLSITPELSLANFLDVIESVKREARRGHPGY